MAKRTKMNENFTKGANKNKALKKVSGEFLVFYTLDEKRLRKVLDKKVVAYLILTLQQIFN